jgi:hypothetical protein
MTMLSTRTTLAHDGRQAPGTAAADIAATLTKPLHLLTAARHIAQAACSRRCLAGAPPPWTERTHVPQACVLAVIAGYADTIGFLRFDAFAGLMTGNTILLGISLASAQPLRAVVYNAIIGTFLAGVLLSRALLQLGAAQWMVLTVTSALHVACGFLGQRSAALLLALAMGMRNAAATRFGDVSLNTVFITGICRRSARGWWPGCGTAAANRRRPPTASRSSGWYG